MSYNDNFNNNEQWNGSTWNDDDHNNNTTSFSQNASISRVEFEENVLSQSFVFMAIALAITAFTALWVYNSPVLLYSILGNSNLLFGLLIGEVVIVIAANATVKNNLVVPSAILFTLYSVINGATLSVIFLAYTSASIVSTFFITAAMFGVMAVYGITTKKDLSSVGSICLMGVIGIVIAGLINIFFLHSTGLELAISIIGVLLFVGLTAYDVQKIKNLVYVVNSENITCIALLGALELYLDFINLFLKLLRILGRSRD